MKRKRKRRVEERERSNKEAQIPRLFGGTISKEDSNINYSNTVQIPSRSYNIYSKSYILFMHKNQGKNLA